MPGKIPILLSFYALSNGSTTVTFGQVTYTGIEDLSFLEYSRRKTFRTLLRLYHSRPCSNQEIGLVFSAGSLKVATNRRGGFYARTGQHSIEGHLVRVTLGSGDEVRLIDGLYQTAIHYIEGDTLVVSDIDDTLVHSFIYDKILKFRTLMFTSMEKRRAVVKMQDLLRNFTAKGAVPIYLSNSEQNLYPLIYRFLRHNHFPQGPLFLKQMRRLWHVVLDMRVPSRNTHKIATIEELMTMFPGKKFILMGDNTQEDVSIYLSIAKKYGDRILYIIIRKVVEKKSDAALIGKAQEHLRECRIGFYYADDFPGVV
ncbi:MAG TPA: App1 family protein [Chryseosolibacter sp.]